MDIKIQPMADTSKRRGRKPETEDEQHDLHVTVPSSLITRADGARGRVIPGTRVPRAVILRRALGLGLDALEQGSHIAPQVMA